MRENVKEIVRANKKIIIAISGGLIFFAILLSFILSSSNGKNDNISKEENENEYTNEVVWKVKKIDDISDFSYNKIKFKLINEGKELEIYGNDNIEETNLVLPDIINSDGVDYKVTAITKNAFANSNISSLKVSKYVTKIDESSFGNCKQLKNITFYQKYLVDISSSSFKDCDTINEINVVEQIEEIADDETKYYSKDGVLYKSDKGECSMVYYPVDKQDESFSMQLRVTNIEDGALTNSYIKFFNAMDLIEIKSGQINLSNLEYAYLPNTITINSNSFDKSSKLTSLVIPSARVVCSNAFGDNNILQSVYAPSMQSVDEGVFTKQNEEPYKYFLAPSVEVYGDDMLDIETAYMSPELTEASRKINVTKVDKPIYEYSDTAKLISIPTEYLCSHYDNVTKTFVNAYELPKQSQNLDIVDVSDEVKNQSKANNAYIYVGGRLLLYEGISKTTELDEKFTYEGNPITPEINEIDTDYGTLKKDVDYEVSYVNNNCNGTGIIVLTGLSNYTGTIKVKFNIVGKMVKISFNSMGGAAVNDVNVVYMMTYCVLPEPKKNKYDFEGWYTKKVGGDLITSTTIVNTLEPQKLYAHWTEKKLKVNIYFDGKLIDTQLVEYGKNATKPDMSNVSLNEGYTIVWNNSFKKISKGCDIKGSIGGIKYKTKFFANGGVIKNTTKPTSEVQYRYSESYKNLCIAVKKGYIFEGWYTQKTDGERISEGSIVPLGNKILYAHWTKVEPLETVITKIEPEKDNEERIYFDNNGESDGYLLKYADNSEMKNALIKVVEDDEIESMVLRQLKAGDYYVQIKTFKYDSYGIKVYSEYTDKKTFTVN